MSGPDNPSAVTINENMPKSNSNGSTKAVAGVIGLLLVISGVYAMIEPMSQRIDFLEREIDRSKVKISDHEKTVGHTGLIQQQAGARERFKEIETQFKGLREVMSMSDDNQVKDLDLIKKRFRELEISVAKMSQCIKMLHNSNGFHSKPNN